MGKNKKQTAEAIPQPVVASTTASEEDHKTFMENTKKKLKIQFRTENQKKFWDMIDENTVTICSGSAGTGKTYVALVKALDLLLNNNPNGMYKRIIIVKPAVPADEQYGFLPGGLDEKLEPYIYSFTYILEKLLTKKRAEQMFSKNLIEIKALGFLRGVTLDRAIVIFDELQNASDRQLKTLLTRIGEDSKYLILGDVSQSDRFKNQSQSALYIGKEKLTGIPGIGIFEFTNDDIVRHPIIQKILEKLEC